MRFILNILLTWAQLHFAGASLDDPGERSLSHRRWLRTPATAAPGSTSSKPPTPSSTAMSQLPTPAARAPGTGDGTDEGRAVGASSGLLPVRGRPLFELGDPYFEADEVLGEFAGRAYLNQFFYTRFVDPS